MTLNDRFYDVDPNEKSVEFRLRGGDSGLDGNLEIEADAVGGCHLDTHTDHELGQRCVGEDPEIHQIYPSTFSRRSRRTACSTVSFSPDFFSSALASALTAL